MNPIRVIGVFVLTIAFCDLAYAICPHRDADDYVEGLFEIVEKGKPSRKCYFGEDGRQIESFNIPVEGCRFLLKINRLSSKGKDINLKPESQFSVTEFGKFCSHKVGDKVKLKLRPNLPTDLVDSADDTCNVKNKEFIKKQTDEFIRCNTSGWEIIENLK